MLAASLGALFFQGDYVNFGLGQSGCTKSITNFAPSTAVALYVVGECYAYSYPVNAPRQTGRGREEGEGVAQKLKSLPLRLVLGIMLGVVGCTILGFIGESKKVTCTSSFLFPGWLASWSSTHSSVLGQSHCLSSTHSSVLGQPHCLYFDSTQMPQKLSFRAAPLTLSKASEAGTTNAAPAPNSARATGAVGTGV